jgi:triphosphoribosyl-dephospho-CoA synthetase
MKEYLEMLNKLLTILGDVTISEAKTWVEVKANAEDLRAEGHEPTEEPSED